MRAHLLASLGAAIFAAGCIPVQIQAPDEPIEINLNVNIRQDIDLVTARINYRFGGPIVAKY